MVPKSPSSSSSSYDSDYVSDTEQQLNPNPNSDSDEETLGSDQEEDISENEKTVTKHIQGNGYVFTNGESKKVDSKVNEVETSAKNGKRKEVSSDGLVRKLEFMENGEMEVYEQKLKVYKRKKMELELMRLKLVKEQTDMLVKVLNMK